MRGRMYVLLAAIGLVIGLASSVDAAENGKNKKKTSAAVHRTHRQAAGAAQPGSEFQGGVLKGPLYNGQDYLGDDPDPNIRSFLMRDKSRYGGPE